MKILNIFAMIALTVFVIVSVVTVVRIVELERWVEQHDQVVARMFQEMSSEIVRLKRGALTLSPTDRPTVDNSIHLHDSIAVFPQGSYIGGDAVKDQGVIGDADQGLQNEPFSLPYPDRSSDD